MYDSVRPDRRQSTRLPRPWDSPGKNTGVGCHFLLQWVKVKSESEVAQSCPTLSDPMDCSLPGSSVHGILQAGVLEWGAIVQTRNCRRLHPDVCVLGSRFKQWSLGVSISPAHTRFFLSYSGFSLFFFFWQELQFSKFKVISLFLPPRLLLKKQKVYLSQLEVIRVSVVHFRFPSEYTQGSPWVASQS